jgi:nitroreductase
MELSAVLRRRRMVRAYAVDRPVPSETVEAVTLAALRVPSAGFTQAVSLLVLTSAEQRAAYWAITAEQQTSWLAGMRTAPVLIMVWTSQERYLDRYAEPDKGWTDRDPERWPAPYWYVDAGMAVLAMLLTASDRELGACFFGIPPERIGQVREAFGVPADQLSVGVVSLGYAVPAAATGSPTRERVARPVSSFFMSDGGNDRLVKDLGPCPKDRYSFVTDSPMDPGVLCAGSFPQSRLERRPWLSRPERSAT